MNKILLDKQYAFLTLFIILAIVILVIVSCSLENEETPVEIKPETILVETAVQDEKMADHITPTSEETEVVGMSENIHANVISVKVSGSPDQYQFSVEISSPDTGCLQYADWWEVITEDGTLLYRRILLHSHVNEQPFTRSGGPVQVEQDTIVIIRAHMNPGGFGGLVLKGSPQDGFREIQVEPGFAADLEKELPLPAGCDF